MARQHTAHVQQYSTVACRGTAPQYHHICIYAFTSTAQPMHIYAAQMYTGTIMASTEVHQQR